MIIAVDFDMTLSKAHYPSVGLPNIPLFKWLIDRQSQGDKIILWTCREYDSYLQDAIDYCKNYGLVFDAVNENVSDIDFVSRKVVANIYIDDAAISVEDINKILK